MNLEDFRVLIVDDEPHIRSGLAKCLAGEAAQVETAGDANEAIGWFGKINFSLVIVDVRLNCELSGIDLLKQMLRSRPETTIIVMTAHGNVETAVEAMRAGAFDFVLKPLDVNLVRQKVRKACEHHQMRNEIRRLRDQLAGSDDVVTTQCGCDHPQEWIAETLPHSLAKAVEACEREVIAVALQSCNLHREKTAKVLGISVRTLHYKMGRYGLH